MRDIDITIHQARLDMMYNLLPCYLGKPKLTFDRTPNSHGQYCCTRNEINLNLESVDRSRQNLGLDDDDFWTLALAHEYSHAYIPTTPREKPAYREQGPSYLRHEQDIDRLAAVILLALAGEQGFPERDRVLLLIRMWNSLRSQYFLDVSLRWSARMRKENPPLPPAQGGNPSKRKPKRKRSPRTRSGKVASATVN